MFHVDKAALVPGQCLFTKTHEGPFIDFGRDFDFDHVGRIYVKESFAREMGVFCGLPSIEERDNLILQVENRVAETADLRARNDELKARVAELEDFKRLALEKEKPEPEAEKPKPAAAKPSAKTPAKSKKS